MKLSLLIPFWVVLATLFISCSEEEEVSHRAYPRLLTLEVTDKTESGAHFNAEIVFRGHFHIESYGFVWSEAEKPFLESAEKVVYTDNIQSGRFSAEISASLEKGVTYYVRPFVKTSDYTVYGMSVPF